MMKLLIKLIIAIIFLATALHFAGLKGKDGRPLVSIGNLRLPDVSWPKVPDTIEMPKMPVGKSSEEIVYQWRGADGVMQFTSQPPPEGIEYTVKSYDTNANVIQSVESISGSTGGPPSGSSDLDKVNTPSGNGSPYSPGKIKKLFDDAGDVQKSLNDRTKQHEAMVGK